MNDDLDAQLANLVNSGWDAPPAAAPAPVASTPAEPVIERTPPPKYPPLPVRPGVDEYLEPQPHGGALKRSEAVPTGEPSRVPVNIGLLADLAAGRRTPAQVATAAGVTQQDLEAELATTLREVDPKEIAKALGIQAAEQQLKSGALYGAVLADLVHDMSSGRLKAEQKIELAKLLAKVGRIEPKEEKNVGVGGGFTLNINLGGQAPAAPIVIDAG